MPLFATHVGALSGLVSRGHVWSGRAPSDSSVQEGISIPTFSSASVVRAVPMPLPLWVMPPIMPVAIDGCLFFAISRQFAQLAQLAASGILQADPIPTPPRDSGSDALETTLDRAPSICKMSQRHVQRSWSWRFCKRSRKFWLDRAQPIIGSRSSATQLQQPS